MHAEKEIKQGNVIKRRIRETFHRVPRKTSDPTQSETQMTRKSQTQKDLRQGSADYGDLCTQCSSSSANKVALLEKRSRIRLIGLYSVYGCFPDSMEGLGSCCSDHMDPKGENA